MPIIKRIYRYGHGPDYTPGSTTKFFEGRVLKVVKTKESRNWSDTLDYSDHRTTDVTWALVYIGTHGVPAKEASWTFRRMVADLEPGSWDIEKARDLEIGERYGWIDCTNLFADRFGYVLEAQVDTFDMQLLVGGPEMIEGVAAWEKFHADRWAAEEAAREAKATADRAKYAAVYAKQEARRVAAEAKLAAGKSAAEGQLARIPAKGTTVTVNGFTGKVFWVGVSKYYGKWNARAGVKNAKGEVQWIDAEKF
jgi:hypothetical protein